MVDRQTHELTQDEVWVLERYRQARACRYATLIIQIQDSWPVRREIVAKEQGPKKEAV